MALPAQSLTLKAVIWTNIWISAVLVGLNDVLLNVELFGFSLTACLLVVSVISLLVGFTILLGKSEFVRPTALENPAEATFPMRGRRMIQFAGLFAAAFLGLQWVGIILGFYGPTSVQRLLSSLLLIGGVFFFSRKAVWGHTAVQTLMWAGVVGAWFSLLDGFFDWGVWGSRHASMFFLVPLVICLAMLRFGPTQVFVTVSLSAAVFSTASRTSTAVALVLLAIATLVLKNVSLGKRLALLGAVTATFLLFLTFSPSVQDRWINTPGDRAFVLYAPDNAEDQAEDQADKIFFNTSGRAQVWPALYVEALNNSPVLGNGAGFSYKFVEENFGWKHPHNEYLRIFADHGIAGLLLLGSSFLSLAVFFLRQSRYASADRFIGVASLLALALLSVTDLPLVSVGVLLPASIVVGCALGGLTGRTSRGP